MRVRIPKRDISIVVCLQKTTVFTTKTVVFLTFIVKIQRPKTWVNHLTHTLTHNRLDFSGQGSTKQHLTAPKSKKSEFSKLFSNRLGQLFVSTYWVLPNKMNRPWEQYFGCSYGRFVRSKGFILFTCFVSCRFSVSYPTD